MYHLTPVSVHHHPLHAMFFASGRVWSFIICSRVILSKPRYKGTNDRMNACLTACTALRTLEMLILKSVESNLFDNAHFIFIRNNPIRVITKLSNSEQSYKGESKNS